MNLSQGTTESLFIQLVHYTDKIDICQYEGNFKVNEESTAALIFKDISELRWR